MLETKSCTDDVSTCVVLSVLSLIPLGLLMSLRNVHLVDLKRPTLGGKVILEQDLA